MPKVCTLMPHRQMIDDFVDAFAALYGLSPGFSPFTVDDYREAFDPDKLLELLSR